MSNPKEKPYPDCRECNLVGNDFACAFCDGRIPSLDTQPQLKGNSANIVILDELPLDNHYAVQEIQPLEYLQETLRRHDGFTGFCLGNIIKYASRLGLKDDPKKETAKIIDYAGHLKKHLNGEKVQPRRANKEDK